MNHGLVRSSGPGALEGAAALLAGAIAFGAAWLLLGIGVKAVAFGVAASYAARGVAAFALNDHDASLRWRLARLGVLCDLSIALSLVAAGWLQSWVALLPFALTVSLVVVEGVASGRLARRAA